jgi:hypothetical protein
MSSVLPETDSSSELELELEETTIFRRGIVEYIVQCVVGVEQLFVCVNDVIAKHDHWISTHYASYYTGMARGKHKNGSSKAKDVKRPKCPWCKMCRDPRRFDKHLTFCKADYLFRKRSRRAGHGAAGVAGNDIAASENEAVIL